jgi:DNA-binding HxlR family transcriptional regulator
MKNEPFAYSPTSGMSQKDFDEAIDGLIEKGMVQKVVIDGEVQYKLTALGQAVGGHLDSNHSDKN